MKKFFKYILMSAVAVCGLSMTSCKDDDNSMSRKVLASVDVLEYDVLPTGPQIITVTSDADWTVEAPEWVSVTPMSGHAGNTEVEISVNDNLRDGTPDNPRKVKVLFKGRNLESNATVLVRQAGDKFRDPVDYTIESLEDIEDETTVRLPNMVVVAPTSKGFVVSDGTNNINVEEEVVAEETRAGSSYAIGDKVSIIGDKYTNSNGIVYLSDVRVTVEGTAAVPAVQAVDVTSDLDSVGKKANYTLITVTGDFDGSAVSVKDMNNKVYFMNPAESLGVKDLGGHKVKVTGYLYGVAAPVVNIIASEIEDLGLNEVIYFSDDFEWIEPWATEAGVHDYVAESETLKAESKNIAQKYDGKTLYEALVEKGYGFVKATNPNTDSKGQPYEDRDFEKRIYLQKNYLKFSLTGIQAGVILPKLTVDPEGEDVMLTFNWSPMRQGDPGKDNRKYDPVHLIVIVENDGQETKINVPGHTLVTGGKHEWMKAEIDLSGLKVDKNTKITIRNCDDEWPVINPTDGTATVNRWFFDNVKIKKAN